MKNTSRFQLTNLSQIQREEQKTQPDASGRPTEEGEAKIYDSVHRPTRNEENDYTAGSIDNSSSQSRDGTILPDINAPEARHKSYIEISEPKIIEKLKTNHRNGDELQFATQISNNQ